MGKRKGNFYKQGTKRARYGSKLDAGMRGVILTCNKRERESVREAYNLLNEYADRLYGPEQKTESGEVSSEEEEEDIEAALKKEVASLKESKPSQRRFQQVDTGTNNVVFVRTPLENPTELIRFIYEDCIASQQSKSRFILRMLPVIGTCSTHDDKISTAALELFEPLIGHGRPITYSIHIKVRNNNGVSRTSLLPVLGRVVEELNPNASVDFNNPEVIINVDVLKTVCCFGFLTDFTKFRKYNLQEIIVANRTVNKVKKKVEEKEEGEDDKSGEKKDEVGEKVEEGGEENDQNNEEAAIGGVEQHDQDQKMELGETETKVTKDAAPQVKVKGVDSDITKVEEAVGDDTGVETVSVNVLDSTNGTETEQGDADKPEDDASPHKEEDVGRETESKEQTSDETSAQNDEKSDKAGVVETTVSSPKTDSDKSAEKDDCQKS